MCDTPEYFYSYIDGLLAGMGAGPEVLGAGRDARGLLRVVQTRGSGYAISTEEELRTVQVGTQGGASCVFCSRACNRTGTLCCGKWEETVGILLGKCDARCRFPQAVSSSTGILLDPVYSGKAVYGMLREMREDPAAWRGRTVLFVHTGGLLVRGEGRGGARDSLT